MTEAAVTKMLALRHPARDLLETRKWIFMFVPLSQDHQHTLASSFVLLHQEHTRQTRPLSGSRLTGQASVSRCL